MIHRPWAKVLRAMVRNGRMRQKEVTHFVQALTKCTRMYFYELNNDPHLHAKSKQ